MTIHLILSESFNGTRYTSDGVIAAEWNRQAIETIFTEISNQKPVTSGDQHIWIEEVEMPSQWIPTTSSLPPIGSSILFVYAHNNKPHIGTGEYCGDSKGWMDWMSPESDHTHRHWQAVTHWMQLPELPGEETQ